MLQYCKWSLGRVEHKVERHHIIRVYNTVMMNNGGWSIAGTGRNPSTPHMKKNHIHIP